MRPGHDGPGNGANPDPMKPLQTLASMRPGHDGPGNWLPTVLSHQHPNCFNEAGARWPRKYVRPRLGRFHTCSASMRPGHDGPGNRKINDLIDPAIGASMRPGHDGPGNDKDEINWEWYYAGFNEAGARWPRKLPAEVAKIGEISASMRPGHDGPGNDAPGRWKDNAPA